MILRRTIMWAALFAAILTATLCTAPRTAAQPPKRLANRDGHWDRRIGQGLNGSAVRAIAASNGKIYVCGDFDRTANGEHTIFTANVAVWDTATRTWSELPGRPGDSHTNGVLGSACAIVVHGSRIYIGGTFTEGGGMPAANVVCFDAATNQWTALGGGIDGQVDALAYDATGNCIYAGGRFTHAGGVDAVGLARWSLERNRWEGLPFGLSRSVGKPEVYALAAMHNGIVVGGSFEHAGSNLVNNIAKLDTRNYEWSKLGTGVNDDVFALAVHGDTVYAGGDFGTAGGVTASGLALWDGKGWSSPGNVRNNGLVRGLTVSDDGVLYVTGAFLEIDGVQTRYVACYSETVWSRMGGGLGSEGRAALWYGGLLYVGGVFTEVDGQSSKLVAAWDKRPEPASVTMWNTTGLTNTALDDAILRAAPNPTSHATDIRFLTTSDSHVRLSIVDALGREVSELVNGTLEAGEHHVAWNAEGRPAGLYYCRLVTSSVSRTKPVAIVR